MKRRKFLLTSGSAILGSGFSHSITQRPSIGLDFDIKDAEVSDPSDTMSIVMKFERFELIPLYIDDSEDADIKIQVSLEDKFQTTVSETITLTNGQKSTKNSIDDITPIVIDGIQTDKTFLTGSMTIEIQHKDVKDSYLQTFAITDSNLDLFEQDLIGWWPLNETSGVAIDYSDNGNNGTVNGSKQGFAGRGGLQAYSFDGDDEVRITDESTYNVDSFTVSAWVKIDSKADSGIVSNYSGGASYQHYGIRYGNNSGSYLPSVYYDEGGSSGYGFTILYGSTDIGDGDWHHLVGTWDGSEGETAIYVDGDRENISKDDYQGILNPTGDLLIGNDSSGSHGYLNGLVCDSRIYSRSLDSSEIQSIYEQGSVDVVSPPNEDDGGVLYWDMNEDPANVSEITDRWSDNNGTIYGSVQQGVSSIRSGSVRFTGSDNQAIRSGKQIGISDQATISAWINVQNNGATSYNRYISYDDSTAATGAGSNAILLYWDADDLLWGFRLDIEGDSALATVSEDIPQQHWIHIAGVWDGEEIILYQNGNERVRKSQSGTFNETNCEFTVGNRSDIVTDHVDSYIDEVRAYNQGLTKSEIRRIYRYGTRGRNLRSELQ